MTSSQLRDLAAAIEQLAREHPCWSQVHQIIYNCTNHIALLAKVEELRHLEMEVHHPPPPPPLSSTDIPAPGPTPGP
jgi:hypothetical protein